jgi:glycosyltransferase involved in cell wall biosynthesis
VSLKVLLVAASYLPNVGGLQTVTSVLAAELTRRGHSVEVLTQRYPRALPACEQIDGIRVRRWMFIRPQISQIRARRFDLWLTGLVTLPLTLARLLWRLSRDKPDIVNLHFVGAPALWLLLARRLIRFRLVVSLHGNDVEGLPQASQFDRAIFHAIVRRADVLTACSRYLADEAEAIEPAIAGRTCVVYNGIAPGEVPMAARGDGLLGIGRLVPTKGFDLLLRALVRCENTSIRLTLIGDGPERPALEELTRELRLEERVVFLGTQERPQVLFNIACCAVVCVPSRHESFSMVALEAMQAGKPVVASRAGGLGEVLADAEAFVVPPNDVQALADAIDQALACVARQPGFGTHNRKFAGRFSPTQMLNGYIEAYATALRASSAPKSL